DDQIASGLFPHRHVVGESLAHAPLPAHRGQQRRELGREVPGTGPPRTVDVPGRARLLLHPQTHVPTRYPRDIPCRLVDGRCARARHHVDAPSLAAAAAYSYVEDDVGLDTHVRNAVDTLNGTQESSTAV